VSLVRRTPGGVRRLLGLVLGESHGVCGATGKFASSSSRRDPSTRSWDALLNRRANGADLQCVLCAVRACERWLTLGTARRAAAGSLTTGAACVVYVYGIGMIPADARDKRELSRQRARSEPSGRVLVLGRIAAPRRSSTSFRSSAAETRREVADKYVRSAVSVALRVSTIFGRLDRGEAAGTGARRTRGR
jgi:hypothetical protein